MNPALIELLVQVLVKYGPDVYNKIVDAIHKENPTVDDWKVAFETPNIDRLADSAEGVVQ